MSVRAAATRSFSTRPTISHTRPSVRKSMSSRRTSKPHPRNRQRFAAALDRAVANGKAVLVLRAGRTERAKRNVIAHTGQLAGSATAWDAFFEQHGAIIVNDLDDLIETTALFAGAKMRPDKHDRGVGLITISGGDTSIMF